MVRLASPDPLLRVRGFVVTPSGSGRERQLGVTESLGGVSPLAGGARREFERGFKEVLVMGELRGVGECPRDCGVFSCGLFGVLGVAFFLMGFG